MDTKLFEIQRQIKENSMSISDYLKDLNEWEKEIKTKDKILKSQTKVNNQPSKFINEQIQDTSNHSASVNELETANSTTKILKRDVNSIKDYYDAWNRINIEEEDLKDKDEIPIPINNSEISTKKDLYTNPKKISQAKANTSIVMTNIRQAINETKSEEYIDKIKTEANAYFSIGNYNKSIELNTAALKHIDEGKFNRSTDIKHKLKIAICNNRGNSHLKQNNYKEGIKDFNYVLENDTNNIKALFRRGFCYYKLRLYTKAIDDLQTAMDLSQESEKNSILKLINDSLNEINGIIVNEKKKMEKFEYSDNVEYIKNKPIEMNKDNFITGDDDADIKNIFENKNGNLSSEQSKDLNINEKANEKKISLNKLNKATSSTSKVNTNIQNILSSEEIKKFVYDLTKENLTSSSFKFAFRNFDDNVKEKEEFLLKINPNYLPKIFMNDMDKNILIEILNCLRSILKRTKDNENLNHTNEIIVVEYLKNLTKTNRFKLILKLISKKEKQGNYIFKKHIKIFI